MQITDKITPCLWFDDQAEQAAKYYTSVFPSSRIVRTSHYTDAGQEIHGRPAGSVMTVTFELAGQSFTALNGGPIFQFNEAISLQVSCDDQQEIDYYWQKLGDGGEEVQCGRLKDRYGLSWQTVPAAMEELFSDANPAGATRAMHAMLKMKKLDIAALRRAHDGVA